MEEKIQDPMAEEQGEKKKYFHKNMIQRRQHNRIFSLKDQNGNRLLQHEGMEKVLVDHFKNLLTESNQNRQLAIDKITCLIPSVVTRDQNLALLREISME